MAKSNKSDSIKKIFPELLRKKMTNVTLACQEANIDRSTYYAWRNEDSDFAAACDESIEKVNDSVESVMYKKILQDHDTTCLIFYSKTKLKNRGYIERLETTGKDGGPITQVNYSVEVAKARLKELTGDKNG